MTELEFRIRKALDELCGLSPKEAVSLQNQLSAKVEIKRFDPHLAKNVVGADVSYLKERNLALAALVIMKIPEFEILECSTFVDEIKFPYVPGLLAFRELPALLNCFLKLRSPFDAVLVDGHGIAHPRKFGLASHLGIILEKPTVGVAKKLLYGCKIIPDNQIGAKEYLYDKSKNRVGVVLRTRVNVKPIYISPGNLADIDSSLELTLKTTDKYRLPEPLRVAHQITRKLKKMIEEGKETFYV